MCMPSLYEMKGVFFPLYKEKKVLKVICRNYFSQEVFSYIATHTTEISICRNIFISYFSFWNSIIQTFLYYYVNYLNNYLYQIISNNDII